MIVPGEAKKKADRVKWLIDTCRLSHQDRRTLYDRRRGYFLHGTAADKEIIYNRIESHLDLVASFLYSADHANFNLSASLNAPEERVRQFLAAQDEFNEDLRDAGLFDAFGDAIVGALAFDSMILKAGWSNAAKEPTLTLIEPWKFGVFAEEITELADQQAFVHSYFIDYDMACQWLRRAGKVDRIKDLQVSNTPFESPFPELITRMIISSTSGENLSGNITGSVNPSYIAKPSYHAEVDRPLVEVHELYVWDEQQDAELELEGDWRIFKVVDPDIIITDSKETLAAERRNLTKEMLKKAKTTTNSFLPGEHPFVHVCPYFIYEYFWGKAHIDALIPLQDWSNERLEQIHDILDRQAYPPRVMSGFMGLSDEKAEAFGGADSWVMDQLPSATVNELSPKMPEDIFVDYMSIGNLFMEASGLTEVLQGKGSQGVRSKGHAQTLAGVGSGRIKKAAVRLEAPLVRAGDLCLNLLKRNSTVEIVPNEHEGKPGKPFLYAELPEGYSMRIAGHSHSPLFADDTKELAAFLTKAQLADGENVLRLLNPPGRDQLIRSWRETQKRKAIQAAQNQRMGLAPDGRPLRGGARQRQALPAA